MPAPEAATAAGGAPTVLLAQGVAIARVALVRTFNTKLFWAVVGTSALPFVLVCFVATMMFLHRGEGMPDYGGPAKMLDVMENLFAAAFVHFGLFFSAFAFGTQATRDDLDDQTLHYFMLQPAPRWLLPLGKYAAYLVFATPCFLVSLLAIQCLFVLPFGWETAKGVYTSETYLVRLGAQAVAIVAMLAACGAFFLGVGSVLRNLFFGLVLYGWEFGINFLPDAVKNFSITYHVKDILPFTPMPAGAVGILSEGPGPLQTVLVLVGLTVGGLALACWRATARECLYTVS